MKCTPISVGVGNISKSPCLTNQTVVAVQPEAGGSHEDEATPEAGYDGWWLYGIEMEQFGNCFHGKHGSQHMFDGWWWKLSWNYLQIFQSKKALGFCHVEWQPILSLEGNFLHWKNKRIVCIFTSFVTQLPEDTKQYTCFLD